MNKRNQGFTLVEIMIVVMILGMLATLSYPSYQKSRENAQRTVCINNLRIIQHAANRLMMEDPTVTDIEKSDLTEYFTDNEVPTCPAGGEYTITITGDARLTCDYGSGHEL